MELYQVEKIIGKRISLATGTASAIQEDQSIALNGRATIRVRQHGNPRRTCFMSRSGSRSMKKREMPKRIEQTKVWKVIVFFTKIKAGKMMIIFV